MTSFRMMAAAAWMICFWKIEFLLQSYLALKKSAPFLGHCSNLLDLEFRLLFFENNARLSKEDDDQKVRTRKEQTETVSQRLTKPSPTRRLASLLACLLACLLGGGKPCA